MNKGDSELKIKYMTFLPDWHFWEMHLMNMKLRDGNETKERVERGQISLYI